MDWFHHTFIIHLLIWPWGLWPWGLLYFALKGNAFSHGISTQCAGCVLTVGTVKYQARCRSHFWFSIHGKPTHGWQSTCALDACAPNVSEFSRTLVKIGSIWEGCAWGKIDSWVLWSAMSGCEITRRYSSLVTRVALPSLLRCYRSK